jgi:mRNA interferase HigB
MEAILRADWSKPSDFKAQFGTASILQDGRVVFNIGGNRLSSSVEGD